MVGTSVVAGRDAGEAPGTSSGHLLFVADTERMQRAGTGAWLDREIGRGAKVYYTGWGAAGVSPDRHWLTGPEGPHRGREALRSGQLEVRDVLSVLERCGGTTAGLHRLRAEDVTRALDEGWTAVAMAQESSRRPMSDDAEATEFAEQERGYDTLVSRWPVRVLCQLTAPEENDAAIWESAAVHHGWMVDGPWSAAGGAQHWSARGDLDAYAARRFGGALAGALRRARDAVAAQHLDVDLSGVTFMDVACARMLAHVAGSAPADQEVRVHGATPTVRRLLRAVGAPPTLVVREGVPG